MSAIASPAMPRRLPPGCVEDRDRHGTIRIYYRVRGRPKIRLRGTPWTPEFMAQYDSAKSLPGPMTSKGITPDTWRWLCARYFAECADYLRLDDRTRRVRRGILEGTFDEPIAPGSSKLFRDFPLSQMTADAIEVLRDRKLGYPEGANNRVKAIRAVFKWAVRKKGPDGKPLVSHNPTRDVPYLRAITPQGSTPGRSKKFGDSRSGTRQERRRRLALALLLFTGQRRSDITRLGRQHVQDGKISFTQFKGRNRKPKRLVLPILPALQRTIDASPTGEMTFLVNDLGRPFTECRLRQLVPRSLR